MHCRAFQMTQNYVHGQYGYKGGHFDRPIPDTALQNITVCHCVCRSTLYQANEITFMEYVTNLSTCLRVREKNQKHARVVAYECQSKSPWACACICGQHMSTELAGCKTKWAPVPARVVDPNDWKARPRRTLVRTSKGPKSRKAEDSDDLGTDSSEPTSDSHPDLPKARKRQRAQTPDSSSASDSDTVLQPCPWSLRSRMPPAPPTPRAEVADALAEVRPYLDDE